MVEDARRLGVGGVVELEAAVQEQSVDAVRAHPAADLVTGLDDDDVDSVDGQLASRREAGQASPDDDDVMLLRHRLPLGECGADGGLDRGVLEGEAGLLEDAWHHPGAAEDLRRELTQQGLDRERGDGRKPAPAHLPGQR